jgi:hypothetical protein
MKTRELRPQHVAHLPEQLEDGVLYICKPFELAAHRCCCGCGEEVVTPLNPAKWFLSECRGRVSLKPSIGNWKFPCQSHYWIIDNQVHPSGRLPEVSMRRVIERDRVDAQAFAQARSQRKKQHEALPGGFARLWLWLSELLRRL